MLGRVNHKACGVGVATAGSSSASDLRVCSGRAVLPAREITVLGSPRGRYCLQKHAVSLSIWRPSKLGDSLALGHLGALSLFCIASDDHELEDIMKNANVC